MRNWVSFSYDRLVHRSVALALFCLAVAAAAPAQESIRSLVEAAEAPGLRWPDFSDYRDHVNAFYRARNDMPAWTRGGRPTLQALEMTKIFADAGSRGVNAEDYSVSAIKPESEARFDVAMTVSLMRYISDLHIGRINPRRVSFLLDLTHKYDLPKLTASLIEASDVPKWLESVEPPYDGYRRLRTALGLYAALARDGDAAALPALRSLQPGESWEGVPQLAALLRRLGDFDGTTDGTRYDGSIVDAVKRFQERHGLEPDGRIGAATLAALNVPFSQRVRQIRLSMERWRWLPTEIEGTPIVVNIPEFRLRAFGADHKLELDMDVVVGKAYSGQQTPVFADTMKYVVFRPYWNVPPSIQQKEMMPKIRKDPGYLSRNGYEMIDGRIRQKPGPNNALGNVKFIFPNSMNIYLHDTQAKQLFSRTRRDFSHGCIRVARPARLAEWILGDDPKWTAAAVEQAMTEGPQDAHVKVTRTIPIFIVYATAVARPDGSVAFFEDLYGHDDVLEDALAHGYPYPL
jgi:murein L,D-transpeptidase YcbB/YkuD